MLLVAGADALVHGAARLAARLGVSSLVVGLTVISMGTSAPEAAVTAMAAFDGRGDIALGNAVGSNICNTLLILGGCATVAPLVISWRIVAVDTPIMAGVAVLPLVMALDGAIGRVDGVLLLAGLVAYTFACIRGARRGVPRDQEGAPDPDAARAAGPWAIQVAWIAAGLVGLVAGSHFLVEAAATAARAFGLSDLVIGLTVVAVGTSAPELATSVLATIRGERDIAVGNVVGSNIFNILGVLGFGAAVAPGGVPVSEAALRLDIPVMIACSLACVPLFVTGHRMGRGEGLLFLGWYAAYTGYLVLEATRHEALPDYAAFLGGLALPASTVAIAGISLHRWRRRRAETAARG